ncbi:hypothetical protein E2C01_026331 [Portunus trituberculatus]|uniref:Uncharacterized protein n=1 Tax=Portunus trituberculatus TaxID=210409 RepID=A0A5B7EIV7_PORTR|nr:hypothetical protein [Portunus trituberculatus]
MAPNQGRQCCAFTPTTSWELMNLSPGKFSSYLTSWTLLRKHTNGLPSFTMHSAGTSPSTSLAYTVHLSNFIMLFKIRLQMSES